MEQLLKKLPGWLYWASAAVIIYLILLYLLGKSFLNPG